MERLSGQNNQNQQQQNNGRFAGVKNLINMFRAARNPQTMVSSMLSQNPEAQQMLQQTLQNGGTYKDAFMMAAKAKGVDPNEIISMLK